MRPDHHRFAESPLAVGAVTYLWHAQIHARTRDSSLDFDNHCLVVSAIDDHKALEDA